MDEELLLFTPCPTEENLDCVVERGGNQFVTLVIENHGHTAVQLRKGMRLGTVTPVDLAQVPPMQHSTSFSKCHLGSLMPRPHFNA